MPQFAFANNVLTTLADAITTTTQTSITLSSSLNLPSLTAGEVYALTLNDAATGNVFEIVYATAITGATLTVERGQEGTTPQTWLPGDKVFGSNTAAIYNSFARAGEPGATAIDTGAEFQTKVGALAVGGLALTAYMDGIDIPVVGGGYNAIWDTQAIEIASVTATLMRIGNSGGGTLFAFDNYGNLGMVGAAYTTTGLVFNSSATAGSTTINSTEGAVRGVSTSELGIANSGISYQLALDTNGNLGIEGSLYGLGFLFASSTSATTTTINSNSGATVQGVEASEMGVGNSGVNYQLALDTAGNLGVGNGVYAAEFHGSGAGLTSIPGSAITGGVVTSVTSDGSVTVSPTTGAVELSIGYKFAAGAISTSTAVGGGIYSGTFNYGHTYVSNPLVVATAISGTPSGTTVTIENTGLSSATIYSTVANLSVTCLAFGN